MSLGTGALKVGKVSEHFRLRQGGNTYVQGPGTSPSLAWHFACFQTELGRSFRLCLSESLQIQAPSPPFPSEVSNLFDKYGGQVSVFPLIWFQCDRASW